MRRWGRSLAVVTVAAALAGCSGGDESADPDVAGPSPLTEAPTTVQVTLASTTSTLPTTTVATTVTTISTTIATTTAPTTTARPPAGPDTGPYTPVPAPTFPGRTAAPPAGDGLPDDVYYAVLDGVAADAPTPRARLTIYQLLTGPEAIAAAQAAGVGLDSDIYVPPEPAVARDVELTPAVAISVAQPDRPGVSFGISAAELARLVSGGSPSGAAPAGYRYVPFPYLVTVQGGVPTRLEQLWAP